ncbi:MAG: hypothetical protein ACOC87_04025 [Candidatus Natronoplasma sp.]
MVTEFTRRGMKFLVITLDVITIKDSFHPRYHCGPGPADAKDVW